MLNSHCRKALLIALSSVLAVSTMTTAAVFGSQDAHTWGIENAQLGIAPGSVITSAKLTIHNAAFDQASSVKTASVRLLNNPGLGTTSYTDGQAGDYFTNCGVLLTELTPASLGTAPRNVVIDLGQINDPAAGILRNIGTLNITLADGAKVDYSSAMIALLDYAGSGRSFGFGIDSDGFTFTDISLELTVAPMTGTQPVETLWLSTSDNTPPVFDPIADQTVRAGQTLTLTVTATDGDNDPLTYSADNLPSGATFAGGIFSWTPTIAQVGKYEVAFTVSDGIASETRIVNITVTDGNAPVEIVIDNRDAATAMVGTWPVSGGVNPYADDSVYNRDLGNSFSFLFTAPETGWYEVSMWWTEFSSRSAVTPVTVEHAGAAVSLTVNQLANGGQWNTLGSWQYQAGQTYRVTLHTLADRSSICADAVRFVKTAAPQLPSEIVIDNQDAATAKVGTWLPSGGVGPYNGESVYNRDLGNSFSFLFTAPETGWYEVSMWWTEFSSRSAVTPVTVEHAGAAVSLTVNQLANGGQWNTLGSWQYQAGQTYRVTLHTLADRSSICADAVRFVKTAAPQLPSEIVIDNQDAATAKVGTWLPSGGVGPYNGESVYNRDLGNSFSFLFTAPETGWYEVSMWWTEFSSRSAVTPVTVEHAGAAVSLTVNQLANGGQWNTLGSWQYQAGQTYRVTLHTLADRSSICADAVRFVKTAAPQLPSEIIIDNTDIATAIVGNWPVSGGANPYNGSSVYNRYPDNSFSFIFTAPETGAYEVSMWWTEFSSRSTAAPVRIQHAGGTASLTVNQMTNGGKWNTLGTWQYQAGNTYRVTILTLTDNTTICADAVRFVKTTPPGKTVKADFSADVTGGTVPLQVTFTDMSVSSAALSQWQWDFNNDGTVDSTLQNPSYTYNTAGTYSVRLTVTGPDGTNSVVKTDFITAQPAKVNNPPVLASIGAKSVQENSTLTIKLSAIDPDGDPITFSASPLPAGATFSGSTFTWTPSFDQAGQYDVRFAASDGKSEDSETVRITVLNTNQPPVIAPIADQTVVVPNAVSFVVAASDPDNDVLTLTAHNLPAGAAFANKTFSWKPTSAPAGTYDVTFTANDGSGGSDSINVRITVKAPADWVRLTFDDFESGWGNYTSGGSNCLLYRHGKYAYQGSNAANIQASGSTAALTLTNGLDVTGYSEIKIDFWYMPVSMDVASDTFRLDYWDGSKWIMLKRWVNFRDFVSFRFYSDSVLVSKSNVTFPSDMRIRFVCEAADQLDDVMLDVISISAR
jgi:PKD repeat protein